MKADRATKRIKKGRSTTRAIRPITCSPASFLRKYESIVPITKNNNTRKTTKQQNKRQKTKTKQKQNRNKTKHAASRGARNWESGTEQNWGSETTELGEWRDSTGRLGDRTSLKNTD